jgi:hypothetical protein
MADGPYVIRGWKDGMNNVLPDYDLPANDEGVQTQLRNVVNADILPSGRLKRRAGTTQRLSGDIHSLYPVGDSMLAYKDGNLVSIRSDYTVTTLAALTPSRRVSYVSIGDTVYYTDGVVTGRVVSGAAKHWGVETPSQAPTLTATTGGLAPGRYMFVVTYLDSDGEESGCGVASDITLASTGGITLGIPAPTKPYVAAVRVYMAAGNDDRLHRVATLAANTSTYTINSPPAYGMQLETQFMREFLACEMLEQINGIIYGVTGNILWHTEPLRYGLYKPAKNYILFPAPITVHAAVSGGMYVVADQTYWIAGENPENFTIDTVLQYTAARGSLSKLPRGEEVIWYSSVGIVQAGEGGKVKVLQEPNVRGAPSPTGATVYIEDKGVKKVMAAVSGDPFASGLSSTDYIDAEIVRARR